jgi:MoxR-like ATPase
MPEGSMELQTPTSEARTSRSDSDTYDRRRVQDAFARIRSQVYSAFVGREEVLEELVIAVLCGGHVLIEDVPGVGKTILAKALAACMGCEFKRIQFTPDVLPSDITGSNVYNQRTAAFEFRPGPIFTQVLLGDEINRATPRAQSALLEAMEERQVTVDGGSYPLPQPFFVLATQNPVELEGTFPLPEAQLDRFLMRLPLGYPSIEDEQAILKRFERDDPLVRIESVIDPAEIAELQNQRAMVDVAGDVRQYLLEITRSTRVDVRVELGASPRASLALFRSAQGRALLRGRSYVIPDDVKVLAHAVLAHRIQLTPQARLRGDTPTGVIESLLETIEVPVETDDRASRSPE